MDAPDPWDAILSEAGRLDEARHSERAACVALVEAEQDRGRARGLTESSPAMALLARVKAAITDRP